MRKRRDDTVGYTAGARDGVVAMCYLFTLATDPAKLAAFTEEVERTGTFVPELVAILHGDDAPSARGEISCN